MLLNDFVIDLYLLQGIIVVFIMIMATAMADILRNTFVAHHKFLWIIVVLLAPLLGSMLYFTIGRKQKLTV